jgi:hypothetical protein
MQIVDNLADKLFSYIFGKQDFILKVTFSMMLLDGMTTDGLERTESWPIRGTSPPSRVKVA